MRLIFLSLLFINIAFAGWQASLWFEKNSKPVKSEAVLNQQNDASGIVMLDENKDGARLKPKPVKQKQKTVIKDGDQSSFNVDERSGIQKTSTASASEPEGLLIGCMGFGPFEGAQESERLTGYFEAQGIASRLFEQKLKGPLLYWLYVEPQATQEVAQKLIDRLRELQIESFLINDGELLNGLSLGLFDNNDEIETLLERLSSLNVKVNKIDKSDSYTEYWVVLEKQGRDRVDETLLDAVANTFPRVQSSEKVCKPVAS